MPVDWDDVLGYSTVRMVKIRDRRLGILYYSALFGIFAYIVGYNILYEQAFKETGAIVGTVRLQLQRPTPQYRQNFTRLHYCGNGTYPMGDLQIPQMECRFLDQYDAVFPALESAATFLTTRVSETLQDLPPGCEHELSLDCQYNNVSTSVYAVGDVEFFTLLIDHTMNVPSLNISRAATEMTGNLLNSDGTAIDPCQSYKDQGWDCPVYINVHRQGHHDIISIKTLMQAAGLDTLDTALGKDRPGESIRFGGTILLVQIDYSNYGSLGKEKVAYNYKVSQVLDTEFKVEQVLPDRGAEKATRTIVDRHGMRIVIQQTGKIGAFSFQTLLVQLVSSLGLLAVAKMVVDSILQYVLPLKYIYRQYKTVKSIDFSDLTEEDKKLFAKHDLVNPEPRIPDHLRASRGGSSRGSRLGSDLGGYGDYDGYDDDDDYDYDDDY